ncbi:MAG: 50S ribosomal protein L20 [Candidatus Moraniibacteriota bacterium]|nr:MAG: 50S ribosomal protein L20 [Candidatus Moranbacteria bacterium]
MARIKRGTTANKRRKNLLKLTKGFKWRRKSHYRAAKEAVMKAGTYKYRDRRTKKRTMRNLWVLRLNNALRLHDAKYSTFVHQMKKKDILLDRKVLSQLAVENPDTFALLVKEVQK